VTRPLGYEASTLLHEAVLAMRAGLAVETVADTIHAHPWRERWSAPTAVI